MPSSDETRFKEHLAELRGAARGLGGDFEAELRNVEKDIARLPTILEKDMDRWSKEIDFALFRAAVRIHKARKALQKDIKAIPGEVSRGARALARDSARAAKAAKHEAVRAKKAVKKDVKVGLVHAAGVRTGPVSEWKRSSKDEER